jgi:hypothetical protein
LGSSLGDFMFQLGLNPDNGSVGAKRSDARRLREQMQRLFNAMISFDQTAIQKGRQGESRVNMTVASRYAVVEPTRCLAGGTVGELGEAAPSINLPSIRPHALVRKLLDRILIF